jgi:putative tricarboxylic transport membrane protein
MGSDRGRRCGALAFGALLCLTAPATAQMARLTIIAPAAPGGGWDQTARAMQQALQQSGAVKVVQVVNIPGAGGTIGLARFISANRGRGDMLLATGFNMVGAVLTNNSPVTLAQTTPIARVTAEYDVLVVPAASPHKTLRDFITAWKAAPGKLAIAGGSAGSADHVLAGLLAKASGMDPTAVNYVPHAGGGEAAASIVGNQVAAGISGLSELTPFIQAGRLRALAVSSPERIPGVAIPTLVEQGVPVTLANWRGIVAPPEISPEQRSALALLIERLVRSPQWKDALARHNWIDTYEPAATFGAYLEQESLRTRTILASVGLVK